MRRLHQCLSLLLLSSVLLSLLTAPMNTAARSSATPNSNQAANDEERGLRFRLSQAPDQPPARPTSNLAATTTLSDAETARILERLGPIKVERPDEQEFALRERSLPPPRTGQTINASFPAAETVPPPESSAPGPLEVVRYSPAGAVPLAPSLSITFSQPMIAISSQEEAAETVPVKLSPQPPGKWRWVGTKTLLFEPTGKFPMATEYSVTIPAGTRSANGGTLDASKTWTFTTPAPTVKTTFPNANTTRSREALMFVEFDQRIEPAAMLRAISVWAAGPELKTRLATKAEIDADENVKELAQQAQPDRWLAFRAIDAHGNTKSALPRDAGITVAINQGAPSAEGPRTTAEKHEFYFFTFGPLRMTKFECGYNQGCGPNDQWRIEFNNDIDVTAFAESQLHIEPKAVGLKTAVYGKSMTVSGLKKPNTTFRLTIDKSIRDVFGQTLGNDKTVEFKVGAAQAWLALSARGFVVLDPAGQRQLSLYSVNYQTIKVTLYAVESADWSQFQVYRQLRYRGDAQAKNVTLPGRLILNQQIDLKTRADEIVETAIDLSPALRDGFGQVIAVIESITPVSDRYHSPLVTWVQSTQIGLDAFVDNDTLIGWATSLADGAPLSGVQMEIVPANVSGTTGVDGVARLALKPAANSSLNLLVARRGNDVAILPENTETWATNGSWHHAPQMDELRWYVFDDRKLYRPGEEVHLKGWLRRVGGGKHGDVGSVNGAVKQISYVVKDTSDHEVFKGELAVNAFGGFDTAFKLPGNMDLGNATVEFESHSNVSDFDSETFTHTFQVQEFRRPEFEVKATTDNSAPVFVGGRADVIVAANYFAGGGLANTEVKWEVASRPTNFTPPNRADYTFGKWFPWWIEERDNEANHSEEFSGRTDSAGKHRLRIDFDSVKPARASIVTASASVMDVNRQTWSATATLLVHPADLYVGLKSDKNFVQQGEPLVVQSIVTDLDGKAIANRAVTLRAVLLDWQQVKGEWKQVESDPQDCAVQSSTDAMKCTFASKAGGVYRITATIHDDRGRANESELTLWVAGGNRPPKTGVEEEKVELIPDRKEYKAGETAEILAQAPFYPAEAVMTLRRSGIIKTERFRFDGPTYTLRIPIEPTWTPNIHVQVDIVGATDRGDDNSNANPGSAGVLPADSANKAALSQRSAGGTPALPGKRPAYASGELNLSIPPIDRRLIVTATPRDPTLEPGSNTVIDVEAVDASGQPVKDSEVAVVVVDESVLALTNYRLEDPVSLFYATRDAQTTDYHSRKSVLLANPGRTTEERRQFMLNNSLADGGDNMVLQTQSADYSTVITSRQITELPYASRNALDLMLLMPGTVGSTGKIRMRENFNALAVFSPSVRTDAYGRAQVSVKLPDNLTRYRVMAVAVAGGKQFGSGESTITARLPLMARPSAPRFLNFGDRFELPIVVQNQTDQPMTVDVAVRATNAQLFTGSAGGSPAGSGAAQVETAESSRAGALGAGGPPALPGGALAFAGRRVTVPANDRVEVRIPVATVKAGTARFQIAAISGHWSDAAEVSLPVWTPATTEAFATYGEIDNGAITQPVKAPAHVFPQFGGLEIETSSTQLQALTDAMIYLTSYPYECSEQISSRIISIAALRDVLTAFKAKDLPSPAEMEAGVTRDLKRLQSMQNEDGGFGFWRSGEKSWPYLSIHVAHALARAKEKKFEVPEAMFEKAQNYLRNIESHIPSDYGIAARDAIVAYALYVRAQMGDKDPLRARQLMTGTKLENLSLESVGWLLSVLSGDKNSANEVAAIRHLLNNRVTETAGAAHFVCSYSDSDYLVLNSDRRADGVILEALIRDQPNSDLIPKLVRGLLANRTRGRWGNTQENVFILLALDRYFNTYEKVTPNFVARAWLGDRFAGEQQFRGRSTDRQQVNVPMSYLANQSGAQDLILSKAGAGRLYYRIGMNYAPSDLNLKAADYGFTVERTYEAVDDPKDVTRAADGSWHMKAGARVRVRLTMVAPSRRYHVALVDPLPAGFESLNPALAITESIPEDKQREAVVSYGSRSIGFGWWLWRSVWFDHQNLRDDRAEAFTSLLWEGVYTYSYVARATTPGVFVVPPSKAEEMYQPETFGRGKTDHVHVE